MLMNFRILPQTPSTKYFQKPESTDYDSVWLTSSLDRYLSPSQTHFLEMFEQKCPLGYHLMMPDI